jgi:hypothetical protein
MKRFHSYPQKCVDWVIVLHGGMVYNKSGMKWEVPLNPTGTSPMKEELNICSSENTVTH